MQNNKQVLDSMRAKTPSKIISWQSPDFVYYKKDFKWYLIVIILAIGIAVALYFMQNYLGIAVVLLAGAILVIIGNKKPEKRLYKINNQVLEFRNKSYPLNDFKSYYVTLVDEYQNLHLEKNKKLSAPISILLDSANADTVIDYIKQYLPENTKITNTASDLFSNWFKF